MSANPIDLVGGLVSAVSVIKADLVAWVKGRVPQVLADATELRNTTLVGQSVVVLKSNGGQYQLDTADVTSADDGSTCIISSDGYRFKLRSPAIPQIMRSYKAGLTLSTAGSSSTFSVAAGVATDSTNVDVMTLASAISKTTSSWAVGTGNGALDTGTIATNAWYHVFEIKRPDTGVVDVAISTSAISPTMPANYTLKRRIGAMKTNGLGQWIAFTQLGDEFLWSTPVNGDANAAALSTAQLFTLSVPPGVQVFAKFTGWTNSTTGNNEVAFSSPDQTLSTADAGGSIQGAGVSSYQSFGLMRIRTDMSARIQAKSTNAAVMRLTTYGWDDPCGRHL